MDPESVPASAEGTSALSYVITGLGRSGTTLLAHLFLRAGYDLGGVQSEGIGKNAPVGGGLEYLPFVQVNLVLQRKLHAIRSAPISLAEKKAQEAVLLAESLPYMQQSWPSVMKDPRFCETAELWFRAGHFPKHVFLCMRHPIARDASIEMMLPNASPGERAYIGRVRQNYAQYLSFYEILLLCLEFDVPYTLVHYPRIGQDRLYLERTLSSWICDPWHQMREVWEDTMHHHQVRRDSN